MRRRPRRGRSRHLSISATDAEWKRCRAKAKRRGLSMARYAIGLVERDGVTEHPVTVLSPAEQRELLEGVREIRALLRGDRAPAEHGGAPAGEAASPPAPSDAGQAGTTAAAEAEVEVPRAPAADGPDAAAPDGGEPGQGRLPL